MGDMKTGRWWTVPELKGEKIRERGWKIAEVEEKKRRFRLGTMALWKICLLPYQEVTFYEVGKGDCSRTVG